MLRYQSVCLLFYTAGEEEMSLEPSDFNKITGVPAVIGMGSREKEEFASLILNRHLKENQPFGIPFQYEYDHSNMVPLWLNDHGDKRYTLTKASLVLLWSKYGKE